LGSLADWKDEFPEERRILAIMLLWGFVEPDLRRYYRFVGSEAVGMGFGPKLPDLFGQGDAWRCLTLLKGEQISEPRRVGHRPSRSDGGRGSSRGHAPPCAARGLRCRSRDWCNNCPSNKPAGPAPMMATCVRRVVHGNAHRRGRVSGA